MPNPSLVLNLLPAPLGPWSFHVRADETIKGVPVDLGFQVFNRTTYGHFEQFLETLVSFLHLLPSAVSRQSPSVSQSHASPHTSTKQTQAVSFEQETHSCAHAHHHRLR